MILVAAISACQKQEAAPPAPRTVMVAQPQQAGVTQNSYSGEVRARQETDLSFRVGGKITQRLVEVGDRVSSHQVLAKLDPTDANLQLGAARAQLESAQSAERTLKADLERYRQLLPSNAISRSQFDQIENQYKTARSNVQQAQANLEVVSNQASYAILSSNKSGVIVARNIEVGQVVSAGQPAYRLAIDGEREVLIGVPEQVIDQFKLRQPVQVSLWSSPDQRLAAYVREIAPAADASRTFAVRVAFNNPQAPVKIGQSARVFVSSTQHDTALQVPLAAITAEQQQSYVLVFNPVNSTLVKKPVKIGAYGQNSVPVLAGLSAQDWVVIGGVHLLQAGQKVQAVNRDNQPVTQSVTGQLNTSQPVPVANRSAGKP
ncbi:efflux RND transporter periplasmic adaptor subunit [Alkanindiges sp. WGS2144]|uniref:efflux RND transporter periplasmic adaptor subunit n=1 Tax=Alkanindiges sp. WGS2144 TaxID=3366808 RepID=UPI003750FDBF